MKILANHAHVFQKEVKEDGTVDSLRQLMDTVETERAVCFQLGLPGIKVHPASRKLCNKIIY